MTETSKMIKLRHVYFLLVSN